MKNCFYILMATIVLSSCWQRFGETTSHDPNEPIYYAYNPEDTIGNELFWQMLRIDSARVEFRLDHPIDKVSSINLGESEIEEKTPEQRLQDNKLVLSEAEAKWFELMRLCSQKQYEDLLSMYTKEETDIGIALATSTNKFELDHFVIGPLLFDQLDEDEAAEIMVKFLEFDKFLTESVVLFGESQLGYVPPQYAFQLEILSKVYLMLDEWEKAEELIEPYRKAVYLLSDDTIANEMAITDFKFNLYKNLDDNTKLIETFQDYRGFLIKYANDTQQDLDEQIEKLDALIEKMKSENDR